MFWHSKYSSIPFIENDNNLIILLKNKNMVNDTIENKLMQIEIDYENKLDELKSIDDNSINLIKNSNSLVLLQKEVEVIKLLTKYALQNNNIDYLFFLKSLKYLHQISEILRLRLKLKEIIHENKLENPNNLPRCSYKFCNYKDTCTYNYNLNIKSQCYQDHYVHNMVSADIHVLIEYIEYKLNNSEFVIYNKEILKTINTLSFVIVHMENELKAKTIYLCESKIEKSHFVKNNLL